MSATEMYAYPMAYHQQHSNYPPYYLAPFYLEQYLKNGENQMQMKAATQNSANSKVKTSLCKKYQEYGHCPYGTKCQFAHGVQELRCNDQQKNFYKTKPCKNFFSKMYCKYENRCNYSHDTTRFITEGIAQSEQGYIINMGFRQITGQNRGTSRIVRTQQNKSSSVEPCVSLFTNVDPYFQFYTQSDISGNMAIRAKVAKIAQTTNIYEQKVISQDQQTVDDQQQLNQHPSQESLQRSRIQSLFF